MVDRLEPHAVEELEQQLKAFAGFTASYQWMSAVEARAVASDDDGELGRGMMLPMRARRVPLSGPSGTGLNGGLSPAVAQKLTALRREDEGKPLGPGCRAGCRPGGSPLHNSSSNSPTEACVAAASAAPQHVEEPRRLDFLGLGAGVASIGEVGEVSVDTANIYRL